MDQGYGYLQIDFGERTGPNNRYEVLRKLGWGMNVCGVHVLAKRWLLRLALDHECGISVCPFFACFIFRVID
jgi:hypothetical protein